MRREEIKEARRTVIPGMSRSVSAITKRKTQMMLLPSFRELHATTQQKTEHTKHAKLHFLRDYDMIFPARFRIFCHQINIY